MKGMNRETGEYLDGMGHLKQSVINILSTPIGSRVMCRDYGSYLFYLIDQPINRDLFPRIYSAVAEAIDRWEPRLRVEQVRIVEIGNGHVKLSIMATCLITEERIYLEDIEL